MRTYQNMNVMPSIAAGNPLQMVFSVWNDTANRIKERQELARHERVVASLPHHLRQDIGELDCRQPALQPLAEKLQSEPQTLETQWLRHL